MRVVLVNFTRAGDVRFFDPSTGTLETTDEHSWKDADGRFLHQDGSLICLFQCRGKLHLFLDGINATVDCELTTKMGMRGRERYFTVWRGNELIYDKTYPRKPDTDGNPFWPSDEEDEDILLWVHNIASSRERQQMLLTKCSH